MQMNARAAEPSGPEVGQVSPNFIGRTFSDLPYRLKNDKGSPKVLNFFWVNCKPCREEMPELALLEKEYPKVKFISVHTQKETPENVQKFINELPGAPSNIVLTSGSVKDEFKYRGLPHTIVLDSENVVLLNLSGYTPDNMMQLKELLQSIGK
jgi:thiol-disulfide isomerase/thioredoxin